MFRSLRWTCANFVLVMLALTSTAGANLVKREKPFLRLTYNKPGSVLNFICGFGVPIEVLENEVITSGFVFKSQHFLPGSPKDLRQPTSTNIHGNERANNLENYRWFIYEVFQKLLVHLGYGDGKACLLRGICELATVPLHHENGLFGEILQILLTPSSSTNSNFTYKPNLYTAAERLGRNGAPCGELFQECAQSFLENYSQVL